MIPQVDPTVVQISKYSLTVFYLSVLPKLNPLTQAESIEV